MYPPDVFRGTLVRLLGILGQLGVRCHLTGGVASVAYGEPRMTQDIDLVVDNVALSGVLPVFLEAVAGAGFFIDESRWDLRRMHGVMPVADRLELGRLAGTLGHVALLGEVLAEPDEISG